jgi:molybdate-binding protein/DNA-binding XRE family transcriptional regulator
LSDSEPRFENRLKPRRERLGLSQGALAKRVGVSRQAIVAIEGGRQVPSTSLGLKLARALRCGVEDLFSLGVTEGLTARLARGDSMRGSAVVEAGARVALGQVGGRWVAHPLPSEPALAADGILVEPLGSSTAIVQPLVDQELLRHNVIVSGCAPILGSLAQRVSRSFLETRATWLQAGSRRSLDQLKAGLVHLAGVHFSKTAAGRENIDAVRRSFPGERMLVINLTRWRQGFVVRPGNPMGIRTAADVVRPGLKLALREEGSAAHKLLMGLLAHERIENLVLGGPPAAGHAEVAQLVRARAADVGVAIESVALAAGLDFVPLSEERFDLIVAADVAELPPVSRLIQALDDPGFRTEVAHLPGYDAAISGHVTTVEAA